MAQYMLSEALYGTSKDAASSSNSSSGDSQTSTSHSSTDKNASSSSDKGSPGIADSEYGLVFSWGGVHIPEAWKKTIAYDEGERTTGGRYVKIYESSSKDAGVGGLLCTIMLVPAGEDYTNIPDYEVLGSFSGIDETPYTVVVYYPTDLQFSPATEAAYRNMEKDIREVASTFTAVKDYTFIPAK